MTNSIRNQCSFSAWFTHGCVCILIAVVILGPAGCRKSSPPTPDANDTNAGVTPPAGPAVVATIGEQVITVDDVAPLVQDKLKAIAENPGDMPVEQYEVYLKQREQEFTREAKDTLIAEALLNEEVKRKGITISDDEIEAHLKANPPQANQNPTTYRGRVAQDLAWRKLFAPLYAGKTEVTETEIQAYYRSKGKEFNTPEQVRVSHILLKAENRNAAQDLLNQIKEGSDFAAMAKAHSLEKLSADRGGDVGFFQRGEMESSFETAAFELQPGELGPLVQTTQGLHILKVTERKAAVTRTLAEVHDEIKTQLIEKKRAAVRRDYAKTLRENAGITATP